MPDSPDFDRLARQVISGSEHHIARVADALREVWNARGAADTEAIARELAKGWDIHSGNADPTVVELTTIAIRSVDR